MEMNRASLLVFVLQDDSSNDEAGLRTAMSRVALFGHDV